MSYSWDFDAPTGVFKNRDLSNDLYENALENSVAMPYVDSDDDFGGGKGESKNFIRWTHVTEPTDSSVAELVPLPRVQFSMATTSITVTEHGVAIPYTQKLEKLSNFNIENAVQRTLMEQKRLVLDSLALTQFKASNVKYVPTGATSSSITFNSTASGTAAADMTYYHIEDLASLCYDRLLMPYFDGDQYVFITRMKTATGLRRDSQFIAWNQYSNPSAKAKGEIGTIERFRIVETNHSHANALPNAGSNSFGSGVVLGREAATMLTVESPHLRASLPKEFGRFHEICWYGIFGFGRIYSGATTEATSKGVSRSVSVTSA